MDILGEGADKRGRYWCIEVLWHLRSLELGLGLRQWVRWIALEERRGEIKWRGFVVMNSVLPLLTDGQLCVGAHGDLADILISCRV